MTATRIGVKAAAGVLATFRSSGRVHSGFREDPDTDSEHAMRNSGKAPTMIIWVICLVLYLVALAAHFGLARIGAPVASWSWIIGFGLLILACRIRGL